ncbi:MAG: hypothetical protein AAFN77_21530 [Planctomycetota bacterium]
MIRLLMVDPDLQVIESHLRYFNRMDDFEVDGAHDFPTYEELVRQFLPDVLLLEPLMNGGIRILEQTDVPIVVLTRRNDEETIHEHPRVKEYFVKPTSLIVVATCVRQIVMHN